MGFVHLHTHTEYSLLDGACPIGRVLERTAELGQEALAITDHGVMFGVIDFYKKAKKLGVRPIIGCEVYVARRTRFDRVQQLDASPYHLILLCKNETGYQNLIKMVSLGFVEGFYNRPRVDRALLERHHEGLICLSACLAGEVSRKLTAEEYDEAKAAARWHRDLFGEENYFLELQDHGIAQQRRNNPFLAQIAQELGLGLVATNDVHYVDREDVRMQKTLLCIQLNTTLDDPGDMEFETEEFYLKTEEEMKAVLGKYPGAITNPGDIAQRCQLEFTFGETKLPFFQAPEKENNEAYFRRCCRQGMERLYGESPSQEVRERLEQELDVIVRMGYVDYFLIVADFIAYAKRRGIPVGPGRGSGAGSIAAYCMGITGVDPLRYGLIFERFLNPERISMPDFDIDFCYERRGEVIEYVVEKYGQERVAQIITFGTMAARGAVRDVGRVMGMPYAQVDEVAKQIPEELKMTLHKAVNVSPGLRGLMENDPQVEELVALAQKIEGMPRHASTHAAGVVITRDPVDTYVPLYKSEGSLAVTQFPMTTLEELGLLKMDFLGLRTLTVMDYACREIHKTEPDFDLEQVPLNDQETYQMLEKGQCLGVFQFESAGMRSVVAQLRPTGLEDLIAVISLYRPGPMDSIPIYIRNRHNPSLVTYKHPLLAPILDVTYGCIVYQEQVMQICRSLGGYSYGQADLVRRAMSKKKHDVMDKERTHFIQGAMERGVPQHTANEIFDEMTSFASYAFNKSHAAAYALVAYRTAYLKAHYPKAFMAALLTSVLDNTSKVIEYIAECSRMGIHVLPPHVNESEMGFTVTEAGIRFGLLAIKNVGRSAIEFLLQERQAKGKFWDFLDLCRRLTGGEFNRRALESLVKAGACDGLGGNRHQMLLGVEPLLTSLESARKRNVEGQLDFFSQSGEPQAELSLPDLEELPVSDRLQMEKSVTGLYISGHPLNDYGPLRQQLGGILLQELSEGTGLEDGQKVTVLALLSGSRLITTRKGGLMAFAQIEDESGALEVLVFPKVLEKCRSLLVEGTVLVVQGRVSRREDEGAKLLADDIFRPQHVTAARLAWNSGSGGRLRGEKDLPKQGVLHLRMDRQDKMLTEKVKNLLIIFQGRQEVYFYQSGESKRYLAPQELWADVNVLLLRELEKLLGQDNVRYVSKMPKTVMEK